MQVHIHERQHLIHILLEFPHTFTKIIKMRGDAVYLNPQRLLMRHQSLIRYRKNSKNWDTVNSHGYCPEKRTVWFYATVMHSEDVNIIANIDPDQTAPLRVNGLETQYLEFLR